MTKNVKGLTAKDSGTLTIRITAKQRRELREIGDVVRALMLVAEMALTDPAGFARSFSAVARDQVLEDLGLPNDSPVDQIHTEVLAEQIRRFDKSLRGELDLA